MFGCVDTTISMYPKESLSIMSFIQRGNFMSFVKVRRVSPRFLVLAVKFVIQVEIKLNV